MSHGSNVYCILIQQYFSRNHGTTNAIPLSCGMLILIRTVKINISHGKGSVFRLIQVKLIIKAPNTKIGVARIVYYNRYTVTAKPGLIASVDQVIKSILLNVFIN